MISFPRTELADELACALQGKTCFGDAHNGLFLTAPRRTGKTTFLRADLLPALERAGVLPVYVELWADVARDPGALIAEAIGHALQPHLARTAAQTKGAGPDKLALADGLQGERSKIGKPEGLTLADALRALHEAADQPVALVIDEAQHALSSEAGENAMTALKSACDQLNTPGEVNLMLVMSGSDRDALQRLVSSSGAPFYGSPIQRMPLLDRTFIAFLAGLIERQRPDLVPVDQACLYRAFEGFGFRPQFFMAALGQVLSPLSGISMRFEQAMQEAALQRQREDEAQMASDYLALKPLEQAVLWRVLELGSRFRPYDADALKFYRAQTGIAASAAKVQNALESLRQRRPALIGKSARGEYTVEDAAMRRWFEACTATASWPPRRAQTERAFARETDHT